MAQLDSTQFWNRFLDLKTQNWNSASYGWLDRKFALKLHKALKSEWLDHRHEPTLEAIVTSLKQVASKGDGSWIPHIPTALKGLREDKLKRDLPEERRERGNWEDSEADPRLNDKISDDVFDLDKATTVSSQVAASGL